MTSPTKTAAWKQLRSHYQQFARANFQLAALFENEPHRFHEFSLKTDQLVFDFSKNLITQQTIDLLLALARECGLASAITDMYGGKEVNNTENRAALHMALRAAPADQISKPEVVDTLDRMQAIVSAVHQHQWRGYTGDPITNIVSIGIGGSELGPAMVTEALSAFAVPGLKVHFVSNVDPSHITTTLAALDPGTTLFIIASKSFTTTETYHNASLARKWLLESGASKADLAHHFLAISTNLQATREFGISKDNTLPMWDWVGGRYSLWSAIGLPIALALGMDQFRQLLAGARDMDQHFLTADLAHNIPAIMGLLGVWYSGFFGSNNHAVIPYNQHLHRLPAFLQQLCMESLGKSVTKNGDRVDTNTGEIVWGEPGTNAQHSFFQLLHQGTHLTPVDFIAVAEGEDTHKHQHSILLANCFAQSMALMQGQSLTSADPDSNSSANPNTASAQLSPHKTMTGNKPSNTVLLKQLNPYTLGNLIAMYEHKVYVQSVIWNINAFDQWGVELGKSLAEQLIEQMTNSNNQADYDDSTNNLIQQVEQWTK